MTYGAFGRLNSDAIFQVQGENCRNCGDTTCRLELLDGRARTVSVRPPSILIVDDEANIRLMLRATLESEGYEIREASNGQEAIAAVHIHQPQLALLDLNMPVVDGMHVLEAFHHAEPNRVPRFIVLTAHGAVPAVVKAIRLGASDFILKPVNPDDLRLSVAAVLHQEPEPPAATPPTAGDLAYGLSLHRVRQAIRKKDYDAAERLVNQLMKRVESDRHA